MSASFEAAPAFPDGARRALRDAQLRRNLGRATATIRARRDAAVGELEDFEALRDAAAAIKDEAQARLPELLEQLEAQVVAAGGTVTFARDADEANRAIVSLVEATGERSVVKVKSMTTAEIGTNAALEAAGIEVHETDLAELIVQLAGDLPSHIVVPAIHRNRAEIRATFLAEMGRHGVPAPPDLSDRPAELAAAARAHLRERFLTARVAISGANFAVAESGSLVVVESEGNGRMCLTLPETLISVVGIDKVVPRFSDLEVFLQLLARSATGERMNPYTSVWRGVVPGDGPRAFHLVLLDNGRSRALADRLGRQVLRCIRCAACLNVCPVYERVGGHAYGSVYPGPIGAVLTPQLEHVATDRVAASLPFASTLCGACLEVCPVRIDIPRLLVRLRAEVVESGARSALEAGAMRALGFVLEDARRLEAAEALAGRASRMLRRAGLLRRLPGPLRAWTDARDAPLVAPQPFRASWRATRPDDVGPHPVGAPRRARRRQRPAVHAAASRALAGRAAVLASVREALATTPFAPEAPERRYRRAGQGVAPGTVDLFVARLEDYGATVVRTDEAGLPGAIAAAISRRSSTSVVVPPDAPAGWLAGLEGRGVAIEVDEPPLEAKALASVDAALTGCAVAIAETGTIVLDGGPAQGRRALSLLPDQHVVVVAASSVVASVPDAIARCSPGAHQTWISGPSATSDIELARVEGVHGPRLLDVVVVEAPRPGAVGGEGSRASS
ncbi:MAG TPA: LUD domain-containing protein [Acidimicrobiales bacterium]|nr:LUD domain-containing protein [Acidimicrobiales bacterium]